MPDTGRSYDIAIIGGGPAGSSCATRLAGIGLKVLLAEQRSFPRPKLCGEFISPECLDHFTELGVLDSMFVSGGIGLERTVFYSRRGRSVTVPSDWFSAGTNAVGLSRASMDTVLLERAAAAGAEIMQNAMANELLTHGAGIGGVKLRTGAGQNIEIKASLVIDATGRSRVLARLFDPSSKKRRADFVAFKTHLSGVRAPETDCEIYSYRGGYGGNSRVEGGLNNLCFIIDAATAKLHNSDAEQVMRNVLFTNKQAHSSLHDAVVEEQWLAVPIESYGPAELSFAPGQLSIGDAAGFIDPFTGSGMLLALESSRIASNVIGEHGTDNFPALIDEYRRHYHLAFARRLAISSLVRRAAFVPFFADGVINCLSMSSWLTRCLAKATRTPTRLQASDR